MVVVVVVVVVVAGSSLVLGFIIREGSVDLCESSFQSISCFFVSFFEATGHTAFLV